MQRSLEKAVRTSRQLLFAAALVAASVPSYAQRVPGEYQFFDPVRSRRPEFRWDMRLSVGEFIVDNLIDDLSSMLIPQDAVLSTLQAKNEADWILKGSGSLPNLRSHSWQRERDSKRLLQRGLLLWAYQQDFTTKTRYPGAVEPIRRMAIASLGRCLQFASPRSARGVKTSAYAKLVLILCEGNASKRAAKLMALGAAVKNEVPHLALRCDMLRMELYTDLGEKQKATELAKKILVRHGNLKNWMGYKRSRDQARHP